MFLTGDFSVVWETIGCALLKGMASIKRTFYWLLLLGITCPTGPYEFRMVGTSYFCLSWCSMVGFLGYQQTIVCVLIIALP